VLAKLWSCIHSFSFLVDWLEIAVEHNGEDAIRRSANFQPNVALVGFVMPGMDGSATGIGLQKVSPHTKIVFIAEPVLPETLESLKAQGYDFKALPAPFERAELEALLETSDFTGLIPPRKPDSFRYS